MNFVLECFFLSDAIPEFIRLLQSSRYEEIQDQCIWGLGNIAGDCAWFRDDCLQAGALTAVLKFCTLETPKSILENAVWTLSNLCRGKPSPDLRIIKEALPTLAALLNSQNEQVRSF